MEKEKEGSNDHGALPEAPNAPSWGKMGLSRPRVPQLSEKLMSALHSRVTPFLGVCGALCALFVGFSFLVCGPGSWDLGLVVGVRGPQSCLA